MNNETIYRCNAPCPINKKCFVIKVKERLKEPITVLQKCPAQKGKDIPLVIGEAHPP